jgi:hypothetical protein
VQLSKKVADTIAASFSLLGISVLSECNSNNQKKSGLNLAAFLFKIL